MPVSLPQIEAGASGHIATTNTIHGLLDGLTTVGQVPWTALGDLGATETLTGVAGQISRAYGTFNTSTAVTVSLATNVGFEFRGVQDATGGRNPSWVGVNVWETLSGQAPNLSNRGAGVEDVFFFENVGGSVKGYWVTEVSKGVFALTDGATIAVDASIANLFKVTLGGNRTISNPTNPVSGQQILFAVKQDATGTRLVTWDTKYRFSSSIAAPTLSTAVNKMDYVGFLYNVVADRWDCQGYNIGFAS